jgi:hypothetical protein
VNKISEPHEPPAASSLAAPPASGPPSARTLLAGAEAALANPLLAYSAIVALQLRVVWNVWRYKDLTPGDTSSYFLDAAGWAHSLRDNIVWSPLYTDLWGTVVALVGNVYVAAMIHRLAIVCGATVLVLALMRSLLGPTVGLLVAVWWALLPPNYGVQYEVHLFGLLPILAAALLAVRKSQRAPLGIVLAVLIGTTLLVRNELLIATAIVTGAIAVHELRVRSKTHPRASGYLRSYAVPLLAVSLLVSGAYWRSHVQGASVQSALRAKQSLNLCQIYAFSYQQRHPTRFVGSPWTDCAPLMTRDFGRPMPSFRQALAANPAAMGSFVAWNTRLLGSGLQVALFGSTVTGDNPDYFPVKKHRLYSLVLSIIVLAVVLAGLLAVVRDRSYWRREWFPPRAWSLIVLGAVAVTTIVVVLSQRPRPEYMYGLTVAILATIGLGASALLRRTRTEPYAAAFTVVLTLALLVAVHSHYHSGPRPLHDAVERLQVVKPQLQKQGVLVTSGYGFEICAYLALSFDRHCSSVPLPTPQLLTRRSLRSFLDRTKATVIYADPVMQGDPVLRRFLAAPGSVGWHRLAGGGEPDGPWSVLVRGRRGGGGAPLSLRRFPGDLANPALDYEGIYGDGWLAKDSYVVLSGGSAANLVISAEVPRFEGQHLQVLVNGRSVGSRAVEAGRLDWRIAIPASRISRRIELRWAGTIPLRPPDTREAAALLKFVGVAP